MLKKNKHYRPVSVSTRVESPLQKTGTVILEVIRLILAAVFIFSGFVKGIDPLGSTYKFQDYLNSFGVFFAELTFIAFPAAIALSTFELLIGLGFLLKVKLKAISVIALLFMLVMLPLTLYLAINNPVTDCGCFGDALIISNWQTFIKNIFITLFVLLVLIFNQKFRTIFMPTVEWILVLLFVLIGVGLSIYSYRHLPMIDFRPYKVGVNIPKAMKVPAGKPVDKYDTKLIYEKDGLQKEFTLADYPKTDSTWVFVEQKSTLIIKGFIPPIHNFSIVDHYQNDITEKILSRNGKVHLLVVYDLNKASEKGLKKAEEIYQRALVNKEPFYALTASSDEDVERIKKEAGLSYPFCKTDPITLKTIVRANPGLMTIEKGTIVGKWNWRDF